MALYMKYNKAYAEIQEYSLNILFIYFFTN